MNQNLTKRTNNQKKCEGTVLSYMYRLQVLAFSTIIKFEQTNYSYSYCCKRFIGGTIMKFSNTGIEKVKGDLVRIDDAMTEHGLLRTAQWDYARVTYDRKFELKDGVYYLRVQGYATEGDVGARKATIQLMEPLLGKHYYPHGVEYGEGENFPSSLVSQCEKLLEEVKAELDKFAL